jgi:hypothetical protein
MHYLLFCSSAALLLKEVVLLSLMVGVRLCILHIVHLELKVDTHTRTSLHTAL